MGEQRIVGMAGMEPLPPEWRKDTVHVVSEEKRHYFEGLQICLLNQIDDVHFVGGGLLHHRSTCIMVRDVGTTSFSLEQSTCKSETGTDTKKTILF